MELYIRILIFVAFPCVVTEQTTGADPDTNFSSGHLVFVGVLILLILLLLILLALTVYRKIVSRRRTKRFAANQQPLDLLSANHQPHREDRIYSISHEDGEDNGYATVHSSTPVCTPVGSQFEPAYRTNPTDRGLPNATPYPERSGSQAISANPRSPDYGGANQFGFLQYATVHKTVSKNHRQEHASVDSMPKKPSVWHRIKRRSSNLGSSNLSMQPKCVAKETVTVGADGTEYLQMTDIESLAETPSSFPPRTPQTQRAFATSTYAHIDHSFRVSTK